MYQIKPKNGYILLEGYIKTETKSGILTPGKQNTDSVSRKRYTDKVIVKAVGSDITDIKEGDEVIPTTDALSNLDYNVNGFIYTEEEKEKIKKEGATKFYTLVPYKEVRGVRL